MASRPIRAVLFDAVGTLFYPDPPVAAAYAAAARRVGLDLPEAEIDRRFRAALARQQADGAADGPALRTSEAQERRRWRWVVAEVFAELQPRPAVLEQVFAALWDHFAAAEHWRLHADAAECWRELAGWRLRLGVASNFDSRLTALCAHWLPQAAPGAVFISSQLGVRKPAASFFRRIQGHLALSAPEILLVGDDPHHDIRPAVAAGWQAVLIDRNSEDTTAEAQARLHVMEFHRIFDLRNLPNLPCIADCA
jgi:HAD superfamily hydrolase (TIGR01549 family)